MTSIETGFDKVEPRAHRSAPVRTPHDFFRAANEAELPTSARTVWLAIREQECESVPLVSVLAVRVGLSKRQCYRLVAMLKAKGFLEIGSGGLYKRTIPMPRPVSSVTPRLPMPKLQLRSENELAHAFQLTFKEPWHVVYKPFKWMSPDALMEVGRQIQSFTAQTNGGKVQGVAVVERELRDGSPWPHLHMLLDAHQDAFNGFPGARAGELTCRRIESSGDVLDRHDAGLRYVSRKIADGCEFEKLPGTWIRWGNDR